MVPHGPALSLWDSLDPDTPARVAWCRPVQGKRVALLLGAFDPPTRAHVSLLTGAARSEGAPAALCLTKILLARPADELLSPVERVRLLNEVAAARGFGFSVANRGTYLEVGRALAEAGMHATFVIGSDKLAQLADPSFYADGERGVAQAFEELRFVVVPRPGAVVDRDDVRVLDPTDVFEDLDEMSISSTEVRRRIREGIGVDSLVPPEVARGLGGYTAAG